MVMEIWIVVAVLGVFVFLQTWHLLPRQEWMWRWKRRRQEKINGRRDV
jgi:hypothetical protein